ncbi:uncharacterized protein LOC120542629 [Polypterus senegalus]|uniref:uncharacterized protein LOC120542629 n=1 Tax=Polypterus senegalus TaxID=55291 RepID=UPI001965CB3C|nr:uncharacterized protein LOC120542629 [Polypterus senegalus]
MVDCGDLNDFNESLRLTNNEVHIDPTFTEETLKTMSCFIKSSSSKADIRLDNIRHHRGINKGFVHFLSDCLDWISSICFIDGFNGFTFWWMCYLVCEYKRVKGDNSLPHLISLFAPFPNMVPALKGDEDDFFDFTFLSQCQQDKVTIPQHREAFQDLRRCVLSSFLESVRVGQRRYTWYYKCMVDCGDLNEFNESLRLTNNEVHVNPNWTEETLKTMSCSIKSFSSKADIRVDNINVYDYINEGFVHFLSDCLDWISSIRFLDGFNHVTFWWMCNLLCMYKRVKGDNSLPHLISLFAPFPNMVPSPEFDEHHFFDLTFLSQCQQDKVTIPEHREAFQGLRRCVLSSLLEAIREGQRSYTWYYKCMVDCGDLNDFNESLRLLNNEVHVNPNWTEETLKTMSCFIKNSSSKADIRVDNINVYDYINERFVHFLSDCLDWISSIR